MVAADQEERTMTATTRATTTTDKRRSEKAEADVTCHVTSRRHDVMTSRERPVAMTHTRSQISHTASLLFCPRIRTQKVPHSDNLCR